MTGSTFSPRPLMSAGRLARQTLTSEPSVGRKFGQSGLVNQPGICARDQPQSRGRVGGAAAETGCDGKTLGQAEPAEP